VVDFFFNIQPGENGCSRGGKMPEPNEALQQKEGSFIEGLAHQVGITVNAKYIYGEPVERDGVTVVPVARAAYGFGGGSGKMDKGRGASEGAGGGGGVRLTPVGYIEIKNGATRFRPTRDPLAFVPVILAAAPAILLTTWKIMKLLRRKELKRKH
jgi:uncharacterized spore protein YtfJ